MRFDLSGKPVAVRWALLLGLSVAFAAILSAMQLSAALLIGPMVAAIALAVVGVGLGLPQLAFLAAQALIGCMIARTMRASLLHEMTQRWPLFAFAVGSVIATACALGFLLTRRRVLPGTTALWGSFPGAATTMVIMAEAYGSDIRLVAFMQYLRVVIVALVASGVAQLVHAGGALAGARHSSLDWHAFAATLALAVCGGAAGRLLRIPAGSLLVPMACGAVLQNMGLMTIELPPALLAIAYVVVGWSIGLRFDRQLLPYVAHALPRVTGAIVTLIAACMVFAGALVHWGGIDPLTAYLAMSPGGADSIAIIAASSPKVDMPFVMALQMSRFLVILLLGPSLARFIADHAVALPTEADDDG